MSRVPTFVTLVLLLMTPQVGAAAEFDAASSTVSGVNAASRPPDTLRLSLEESIERALADNRRGEVSDEGIEIAAQQLRQARSAFWPEVSSGVSAARLDSDPEFVFPASSIEIPEMAIPVPESTIVIPANSFGPGFPPADVPLTTPASSFSIPAQSLPIPQQNVKLMDRDTLVASIGLTYPLYAGGLRRAMVDQAKAGIAAAKQEDRKTDSEIVFDVTRAYYGAVVAQRLLEIAQDSLARMEATLLLTERLYQTGSGQVKKTDYLRNKVAVETLRSASAVLNEKRNRSLAALSISLGLEWDAVVRPSETVILFSGTDPGMSAMVGAAGASPDIVRIRAALAAAEAKVREARSGRRTKLAVTSKIGRIFNDYDAGIVSPQNKRFWAVGLGLQIPIFDGSRSAAEVAEAQGRLRQLEAQARLARDAKSLEVEQAVFQIQRTVEQEAAAGAARDAAVENRELHLRAYQEELVETKDVIEAQLVAAWMAAQYELVLYDHAEARARLDFAVGSPVSSPSTDGVYR